MKKQDNYTERSALIVIDMQYEFVDPKGAIYVKQAEEQLDIISKVIGLCRNKNIPVVYTKVIWDNDSEVPHALLCGMPLKFRSNHNILRRYLDGMLNPMTEIHEKLKSQDSDYVVEKKYFDAFYNTDLNNVLNQVKLKQGGLDNLMFVGTTVNNCVYSTMLGAAHRNYRTTAIRDCISGFPGEDLEFWFSRQMPQFLGTLVLTSENLKEILK